MKNWIKHSEKLVENKPKEWRLGQAYYRYASILFPKEVSKLKGVQGIDPFYDDNNIESFLNQIKLLNDV